MWIVFQSKPWQQRLETQVNGVKVSAKMASSESLGFVSKARRALASLLWDMSEKSPRRGRLLLEQLEGRQLMAGDMDMLFTNGVSTVPSTTSTSVFSSSTQAEGEAAPDLVAFAKALRDSGQVTFFGANWCPFCTQQKQLFEDGGQFVPFVEVTRTDRTFNARGIAEGISVMPTWVFTNTGVEVRRTGILTLAEISTLSGIAIPSSDTPTFTAIGPTTVAIGSPLHVPIDAYDPGGGPVTITVSVADPTLLQATVLANNRSIRFDLDGYGDMVFELFEDLAPRPAGRIISLANSNFFDNLLFHRVIDGFVIQGGDGEGAADGVGGSTLPDFDDQFNADLQHNRSGILSYAKTTDDTNDSQFFITAAPTRSLDFNHSIFGQLVEGDDVRYAINKLGSSLDKGTDSSDKPLIDVRITSADVFNDNENSVIRLKAIGNRTGTTNVTITATDATGRTFTQVVPVTVAADSGSGSNSQPFLNDIPAPASAPNSSPLTLQLSSVDVEGDAVTFTATSATTGVTAAVNATTGLVTVTPSAGFTGAAVVNVGVRPASGVAGTLSGQNDNQRVTFNFASATAIAAPTGVDLATASDSGTSSTDNRTNAGSLTFTVTGVSAGNEVRLFSGTTEIGRGTATGTTINITSNNIAALGDGTYNITARQFSGTNSSTDSPSLTLIYDATQPARLTGFPTTANINTPLELNFTHPEEGNGLSYSFSTPVPTGAAINAATGAFTWTPTTTQLGTQSFNLALTDAAGNVRSETFAVTVAGEPLAGTRLEVANLAGNVVTSVAAGDEFLLRFFALDLRGNFDVRGVFTAYADILFDSTLVTPVTTTPIQYGPSFSTNPDGTIQTGLINELGAIANVTAATNQREVLVATIRMRATRSGAVTFTSDSADTPDNDFSLFGLDDAVQPALIRYGRTDLSIGGRFTAANDTFSVAQGAAASSINVLANDTFSAGVTGTLTVTSLGTPSRGGTVTIANNAVRYQPAALFAGSETFTYVATDNTGVTQTATVSVTVTGTNNPPPTAVNDSFSLAEDAAEASFNVRTNDSTADAGETISVSAVGTSTRGSTFRLGTDGATILYRPAANLNGTETVTYTLLDSRGASATGTVTFTVTAVNDAPPASAITKSIFRSGAASTVAVLADYGTNVDATETLTVALVGTASGGGTFAVSGTSITFTPPSATFTGTATISYTTTDAGSLASTGLITVTVLTASPTDFLLILNNSGGMASVGSNLTANLTGTTTTGQAVNRSASLSTSSTSLQFPDLAPGTYQVEDPAVPFLLGMEQAQRVSFTAAEAGGSMTGNVNVGTLDPRFISIRDFFNSAPRQAIFAAVAPGSDSLIVLGGQSATNIISPIVNLNSAGSSLTIRGNTSTGTASQATVPAVNDRRVETRATSGSLRLLKISLAPADVTFAAPTIPTVTSPSGAEGEARSASRSVAVPAGGTSDVFFSNPANAEGESSDLTSTLAAGEPESIGSVAKQSNPLDDAFADVTESLTRISATGDALAEDKSTPPSPEAVDELLSS